MIYHRLLATFLLSLMVVFASTSQTLAESFKFGEPSCEKCQPGEYLQIVEDVIAKGPVYAQGTSPPCSNDPYALVREASKDLNSSTAGASGQEGDQAKAYIGLVAEVAKALEIRGSVGKFLGGLSGQQDTSTCKPVCQILPEGAKPISYRVSITNTNGGFDQCPASGGDCAGYARTDQPFSEGRMVCAVVSNWSHSLSRTVRLHVWFTSPVAPLTAR